MGDGSGLQAAGVADCATALSLRCRSGRTTAGAAGSAATVPCNAGGRGNQPHGMGCGRAGGGEGGDQKRVPQPLSPLNYTALSSEKQNLGG